MGEIKKVIEKYINDGLPKLFVFDLDYTLWPFWVDTHVQPPFVKDKHGRVSDAYRQEIKLYPGVREILDNLKHFQCQIAAASRTDTPKAARDLMSLIGIDHHFDFKEIYPGKKIKHFQKFRENSGIDYHEMVFFDDEHRNIADISKLGVTCVLVKEGLSAKYLEEALLSFRKNFMKTKQ